MIMKITIKLKFNGKIMPINNFFYKNILINAELYKNYKRKCIVIIINICISKK